MTDLRYAIRTLRRAPGFSAVAVVTLALGIGANSAVFSVANGVLFRPLPYRDPSRLVAVWDTYLPQYPKIGVSPVEMEAWKGQTDLFEQTAWYRYVSRDTVLAIAGAEPVEVHTTFIDPALLPLLGIGPALGRGFAKAEPPDSAILSDALWRTRFHGDPSLPGRTIRVGGQALTVAGVMPAGFAFPDWADLWLAPGPLQGDEMSNPVRHASGFVARLRPGVTAAAAAARLQSIALRLAAEHPKTSTGWNARVAGLQEDLTVDRRQALLLLLGAAILVLLMACANVANLFLARAAGRFQEVAVRAALGAGWWRLARQRLVESLMLAAAGGALGLVLAAFVPVGERMDLAAGWFLLGASVFTGLAAGAIPAIQSLRGDLNSVLKASAQAGGGTTRLRSTLVVLQFALAVMLATGAGILMKSFVRLMGVDPGFQPRGLLTLRLSVPPAADPAALWRRLDERVRSVSGVAGIASTNTLPLIASRAPATRFYVPGAPGMNPDALPSAQIRLASPDYFRVLGVPLRSGRAFTEADVGQPVVIVNETMARRYWPGRDPVGMKFVTGPWGPNPAFSTVIGVAGDVKQFGLDLEPTMDLYFPNLLAADLVVRTAGNPLALAPAVRRIVREVAPEAPIADVRTMDEVLAESARTRRWTMTLLGTFAAAALLLALVGIYGVVAGTVAERRREIGIRMALGAGRGEVLAMVLRNGMKLGGTGLAIGAAGAWALRRVLAGLVFGVSPGDPAVYAAVAGLMALVAALACYVPARRASRVDPLAALRWE